TRARLPDDAENFTPPQLEGDVIDRQRPIGPLGQGNRQSLDGKDRSGVATLPGHHPARPTRPGGWRSPSASRLRPNTSDEIARHGNSTRCGNANAMVRPSFTMPPQSGVGGGNPRPRNPNTPMVMAEYPSRRQK